MERPGKRIFAWKVLLVRLYVLVLVGMLALSLTALLAQPASAAERTESAGSCSVTIKYHGKTTRTTGQNETVAQLLQRLELEVSGEDVVSHGMEEPVYDGMELTVDRVITVTQTYTAAIPHGCTYCNDPSVPQGMEAVLTEGVDGELLCTAEVTYINGVEARRQICSETVTRAPVTEVIGTGTGETAEAVDPDGMPVISDGYITLPTGEVLTYTDTATIRATAYTHTDDGCDFITSTGTTVRWGTVAVDPRYIPYGTRMFIVASNGSYVYGLAMAEDCGGDIKGDRMDLYMPTYEQCMDFGRRVCTIYFLG
nr:G5 domain-containing protein [Oscillospiraceae bacterium]